MTYKCPKCGGTDLRVHAVVACRLVQERDGNMQTEVEGDHEWDGESKMMCVNPDCEWTGFAEAFDTECDYEQLALMIPAGEHWTPRISVWKRDDGFYWTDLAACDGRRGPFESDMLAWKAACIAHDMLPEPA